MVVRDRATPTGHVVSKVEAGTWALERLPTSTELVRGLARQRGEDIALGLPDAVAFAEKVKQILVLRE